LQHIFHLVLSQQDKGVFLNILATSIKSNLIPISLAIAGKCKAAFVDPPVAATIVAAFSKDFL